MNIRTATGACRWTRSLIAAVAVAAALPSAAEAGTAEVRDGKLLYTARNAEVNNVNLRLGPTGKLVISDTAAKVAGAGCLLNGSGDLECDAASVTSIEVSLADRNDIMRYRAPHPGVVRAGLGSDTFLGGLRATPSGAVSYRGDDGLGDALRYTEADRGVTVTLASGANDGRLGDLENAGADIEILEGSPFGDTLTGSADDIGELFLGGNGNDTINGGDGPDRIDEGNARNGADTIDGGPGRDMIDYSRRNTGTGVTLNDIAEDGERTNIVEGDNVKSSIEDVITGRGSDIVHGNRESNDIRTGAGFDIIASTVLNLGQVEVGGDTINPGSGTDTILAGRLGDMISARDGESDHIDCREGLDFATTDVIDRDPGNGSVPQNSDQISECEAVDAPDLP